MIEINTSIPKSVLVANKIIKPWKQFKNVDNTYVEPLNFKTENTTVWSFPDRGNWSTHTPQYRGNWSPRVVRNLLELYSKKQDLVLDPMVGGGTTPVECKLLGRNSISVDINPDAINITKDRLSFKMDGDFTTHKTYVGDARNLDVIQNDSIDLILSHPPYGNMIRYTSGLKGDLSLIEDFSLFFKEYESVVTESFRVLKPGSFCAVLIGDTHRKGHYVPLSIKMMLQYMNAGFVLKEEIIKQEWNCNSDLNSQKYPNSFLLTAHEHLFVFRKPTPYELVPINSTISLFK